MQSLPFQRKQIVLFFFILSVFWFLVWQSVSAQDFPIGGEQIAPFLDDQGVAVVHLDLRKVDPEYWAKQLTEFLEQQLPQWGFERKSVRGIMQEWNALLPKKLPPILEPFNRLTKEAEIMDLYFIGPIRKTAEESLPFFMIPLKGKNDKQKQTVRDMVRNLFQWSFSSEEEPAFLEFKEALIFPITDEMPIQEDADTIRENLESIKPISVSLLSEAWKSHENDLIRGIVFFPKNLVELVEETENGGDLELESFKTFADAIQTDVLWFSFGFDLERLRCINYLKMKDETAAQDFMKQLKILVDEIAKNTERNANSNEVLQYFSRVMRVSFEEISRMVMPRQEGDRIVATIDSSNFMLYYFLLAHVGLSMIDE